MRLMKIDVLTFDGKATEVTAATNTETGRTGSSIIQTFKLVVWPLLSAAPACLLLTYTDSVAAGTGPRIDTGDTALHWCRAATSSL